ncbi:MAG: UvrD-helicase domain-containing protein [Clostridiales bacterium]|nr:UvrD-helicase domain-containing protein [Clostridiales bacterium]
MYDFSDLNAEQTAAVNEINGYVRVIAGAGTGKTRALTCRYVNLVENVGIPSENVLCVTFTNKAAQEMKNRVKSMLGDNSPAKYITTFHSLAVKFFREDYNTISFPPFFDILDSEDSKFLIQVIIDKLKLRSTDLDTSVQKLLDKVHDAKIHNRYSYPEIFVSESMDDILKGMQTHDEDALVFYNFLYEQRKAFKLDFDDLIHVMLHVLNTNEKVRMKWQSRMQFVMVDEFQDVSYSNYAIASILSDMHKNLFIVGDPDQTIYSWRGAKVAYILNFEKMYPGAKTLFLNANYRSTPEVIKASNALISKNKERIQKSLVAINGKGSKVLYCHCKTATEEANFIARSIMSNVEKKKLTYSDFAVLYRAHFVSMPIEEVFRAKNIPYRVYSGTSFYERKEIKDMLSYMKLIFTDDDLAFRRVINEPLREIGLMTMKKIEQCAESSGCSLYKALKKLSGSIERPEADRFIEMIDSLRARYNDMKVTDIFMELLYKSGYESMLRRGGDEERLENLSELKAAIRKAETDSGETFQLQDYFDSIALYTNMDYTDATDKVRLMSVHAAKGLEFPIVFVAALNEGIFPSAKIKSYRELEEERRLAYVAMTRAEKGLVLSDSEGERTNSRKYPSRFIFNIERSAIDYMRELPRDLVTETEYFIRSSEQRLLSDRPSLFNVGDNVTHSLYGTGIVADKKFEQFLIKFDNRAEAPPIWIKGHALQSQKIKPAAQGIKSMPQS